MSGKTLFIAQYANIKKSLIPFFWVIVKEEIQVENKLARLVLRAEKAQEYKLSWIRMNGNANIALKSIKSTTGKMKQKLTAQIKNALSAITELLEK